MLCGISDGEDAFVGKLYMVAGLWFSLEINLFENNGGQSISSLLSLSQFMSLISLRFSNI